MSPVTPEQFTEILGSLPFAPHSIGLEFVSTVPKDFSKEWVRSLTESDVLPFRIDLGWDRDGWYILGLDEWFHNSDTVLKDSVILETAKKFRGVNLRRWIGEDSSQFGSVLEDIHTLMETHQVTAGNIVIAKGRPTPFHLGKDYKHRIGLKFTGEQYSGNLILDRVEKPMLGYETEIEDFWRRLEEGLVLEEL